MELDYTPSLYGTDDYVRGIYRFKIVVKEDLRFTRLVIFQCGSDDYNYTAEKKMAIGNEKVLINEWNTQWGDNVYRSSPMALEGLVPWIREYENTWRMIHREASRNTPRIEVREGVLLSKSGYKDDEESSGPAEWTTAGRQTSTCQRASWR